MGTAVNRPELQQAGAHAGKQASGSKIPPERNADGGMTYYSDWFAGARAVDRLRIANQALGFVGGRGSANAFARAHRQDKEQELLRASEALKRQGMTDGEVVGQLKDPQLERTEDKI